MEYYSAIKRNEIELFVVRWMELESVIQTKVKSEREKQILYPDSYIWNLKKTKGGTDEPSCRAGIKSRHREWT